MELVSINMAKAHFMTADYREKMLNDWKMVFNAVLPGDICDFSNLETNSTIVEHPGYLPIMLPYSPTLTVQRVFNACVAHPDLNIQCYLPGGVIDDVIVSNDRDPAMTPGGYFFWVCDDPKPDPDCTNTVPSFFRMTSLTSNAILTPTMTLMERLLFELYYHIVKEQSPAVDKGAATLCTGTVLCNDLVPVVNYDDNGHVDINAFDLYFGALPEVGARRVYDTPPAPLVSLENNLNTCGAL